MVRCIVAASLAAVLSLTVGCRRNTTDTPQRPRAAPPDRYLVGAHYYYWYPQNFRQGYLRKTLVPAEKPALGIYRSDDPRVIEQHIAWCSRYGVDFLALDWWPGRDERNAGFAKALLAAPNLGDVKFCVFYETWTLNFDKDFGTTTFTDEVTQRFLADMTGIARTFFNNPAYLRVQNRPVVFLYLSRTFCGRYREALTQLRAKLAEMGHDVYLVGDEIFWKVVADRTIPGGHPEESTGPQRGRIMQFDAITAYNLYEGGTASHRGYGAESAYVEDSLRLYRDYSLACGNRVALVPSVTPGYNDRGVRPSVDHYPIPRQWRADLPEGTFLAETLERVAFPLADPVLNMIMITTWNEWNEDTAIEPLDQSPPTSRDQSESGTGFTQGYSYSGHGTTYLEVLRDKTVAVAGCVIGADGAPARGVSVSAWVNGGRVTADETDAAGCYTLSRLRMPPGAYEVGPEAGAARTPVQVVKDRTTAEIDFRLGK